VDCLAKHFPAVVLIASLQLLSACGGGDDSPEPAPTPTSSPTASPSPSSSPSPSPSPTVPPGQALPPCPRVAGAVAQINVIQGTGIATTLVGQAVTVRGVVVGDFQADTQLSGFFIQEVTPDADPATSEGVFVYAPGARDVAVGDYVQVAGQVAEFTSSGEGATDSITQIANPTQIDVCGQTALPTPVDVTLPVADSTALEHYEGMSVRFTQTLAVTELFELGRFGQLVLATTRQLHPNNTPGAPTAAENSLARIVLDDGSSTSNPTPVPYLSAADSSATRRMGDTVTGVTGVMSHNFNAYRVHPTAPVSFSATNPRLDTPPAVTGTLKVASFNVLNYFTTLNVRGADTEAEFTRQRDKIVAALAAMDADVVGLIEIENNADTAVNNLVEALNAGVGAGTYVAVGAGSFGTDEIKVDIIYKPAKVSRIGNPVLPTGQTLADYTVASDRPPLAQRFQATDNNGGFWFVVNHFKSKGSCPTSSDIDQGQGCWNQVRTVQAQALKEFAATLSASGEADVLMMGDFNSYLEEDPVKSLEQGGFESLLKRLAPEQRFTYVFDGETGALDHAYASNTLRNQITGIAAWHINADEPTVLDYNLENKTDDRYAPTAFRSSDHDPVLAGLTLTVDAPASAATLSVDAPANAQVGTPVTLTNLNAVASNGAAFSSLTIDWGDGTAPASIPAGQSTASLPTPRRAPTTLI
jgi:uncharacterized protein